MDYRDYLLKLTHDLHGIICDCDDKYCTLEGEIHDWLYIGDMNYIQKQSLEELAKEYLGECNDH